MEQRVVVVTGASGGIGSAIVARLLAGGFSVVGLDRTDTGFAAPGYTFLPTDITSGESVASAFSRVFAITDRLCGIVNAAGIVRMGSQIEEDPEWMQQVLDVNVAGMARVTRVFFPLLEAGRGRVVNLSSEYGRYCSIPFHGYYTASKHAVECYSDSLRRELGYLGMKVSVIRPGAVDTPMTHGTVPAFDRLVETSAHYKKTYRRLYPLMAGATKHPTPPDLIADRVFAALTKKHPRRAYNVRQDARMKLLSRLPARLTDGIFRRFF